MLKISVVIPSYNRRELLLECLASVAQQSYKPHEVIVVDDGSTDGTIEVLQERVDLHLIVQENAGPGAARNTGAKHASGDYIAFLDSDDVWFPWSLETMAKMVERDSPTLVFGAYEDFDAAVPALEKSEAADAKFLDYLASADHGYFAGAGMILVDRDVFSAVGGFIEDRLNAEDHDLALKLGVSRGFVKVLSPVTVAHRVHQGNAMGDAIANWDGVRRLISREQNGVYDGGVERRMARRKIICGHARSATISLAQSGKFATSIGAFFRTFIWNIRLGRVKFVLSFPALLGYYVVKSLLGGSGFSKTAAQSIG